MKTNLLPKFLNPIVPISALAMALTCLTNPAQAGTVLPAVGPRPLGEYAKVDCGYLTVFSSTEQTQWGENSYYYPHTGYRILDGNGKMVKWVDNHNSVIDEAPQKVELPPGTYTVRAWSDHDGMVAVPVVIKLARNTTVHLEDGRDSDKDAAMNSSAKTVKSPSGQIVGWKA